MHYISCKRCTIKMINTHSNCHIHALYHLQKMHYNNQIRALQWWYTCTIWPAEDASARSRKPQFEPTSETLYKLLQNSCTRENGEFQQGDKVGRITANTNTVTWKINGNRSDGVPVVNWYKSALENRWNFHLFCKSQYYWSIMSAWLWLVYVSVCLSFFVCLSVFFLSVFFSVCLSVCLSGFDCWYALKHSASAHTHHIHLYIHTYTFIHAYIASDNSVADYNARYAHASMYTNIRIYIHTHLHTYIYAYTHT
jgi:hypothetical protein